MFMFTEQTYNDIAEAYMVSSLVYIGFALVSLLV